MTRRYTRNGPHRTATRGEDGWARYQTRRP